MYTKTTAPLVLALTAMIATLTNTAKADEDYVYKYHPAASMRLGKGIDPAKPNLPKWLCLDYSKTTEDHGTKELKYESFLVSDSNALKASLLMDTSVEASVLAYKGKGSFSLSSEVEVNKNSMNVVIRAHAFYRDLSIDNWTVKPRFQKLLDDGKIKEFTAHCGSRIVSTVKEGVVMAVMISVDNLSDSEKLKWRSEVEASGGFGPLSGSAKSLFEATFSRHAEHNEVRFSVYAQGGAGLEAFADAASSLVKGSTASIDGLSTSLHQAWKGLSADNGTALVFYTTTLPGVDDSYENLMSDRKEAALRTIADEYRETSLNYKIVHDFIVNHIDPRHKRIPFFVEKEAFGELPKIKTYTSELAKIHERCLNATLDKLEQACESPTRPEMFYFSTLRESL